MESPIKNNISEKIVEILNIARNTVVRQINQTMVSAYFEIGRVIIEEEQKGNDRADYGKSIIKQLSADLTKTYGKGFSITNIQQMRAFYLTYQKQQTVSAVSVKKQQTSSANLESKHFTLSWSHYLKLMRIDDENERNFYEIESYKNNWSVRNLERQYDSGLYHRITLSKNNKDIVKISQEGHVISSAKDLIKDPYILEFIGLNESASYSESELEQRLIDKLEHFLLELGNGFTFVARQKRITFEEKHFRIDLVFYNRIIKAFVLIDLKIGELKHQDLGQMQMYVNYFDREIRLKDENKTIGIILCQDKSEAVVKYTLPEDNEQIFASKYKTILPTKEEFKRLITE